MHFSLLALLSTSIALSSAAPSGMHTRGTMTTSDGGNSARVNGKLILIPDIPADEMMQFKFWVQYAAAAYCYDNYASKPGHKLTCWAGNCPQVEVADTSIVYDFSK